MDEKTGLLHAASSRSVRSWKSCLIALLCILIVGSCLLARLSHRPKAQSDLVFWLPCLSNLSYLCATISLPRYYLDPDGAKVHISVIKVPAKCKKEDRLGSIFINPGGPGGSGVDFALRLGDVLRRLTDERYDIIGFDPRGIGRTKPLVQCFDSTYAFDFFKAGTVYEKGFDVLPGDPQSDDNFQHLVEQHRQLQALQETAYAECAKTMGDELKYMGTPFVARDIVDMNRILEGEDAKVNFFGGSYGSVLGMTLVNMFPRSMGKVYIDGIASTPLWMNNHTYDWLPQWLDSTEAGFDWFLRDCSQAGPVLCPLAKEAGENPDHIGARLIDFVDRLWSEPMAMPDAARPGVLTSGQARRYVLTLPKANQPGGWPRFSRLLSNAMEGNATEMYELLVKPLDTDTKPKAQPTLSRVAVSCADAPPFRPNEFPSPELMAKKTLEALKTSPRFGASVFAIEPDGGCQYWPVNGRVPGRFRGPFTGHLETPMMIASNLVDPITPLSSAKEVNRLMPASSFLLIQNGTGHCTLGSASRERIIVTHDYFVDGKIPENKHVVQIDRGYFERPVENETSDHFDQLSQDLADSFAAYAGALDGW